MRKDLCFALVGGDLRQSCLANLLAGEGYEVYALGFDDCVELTDEVCCTADLAGTLAKCDVAIFPLPLTVDGTAVNAPFAKEPPALKACLRALNKKALLLGGMASEDVCALAREYGFAVLDYYQREEMIVRNCVPTAEGALCIAMQETAKTIFGSKCLVTGFGRVSRAMTAPRLLSRRRNPSCFNTEYALLTVCMLIPISSASCLTEGRLSPSRSDSVAIPTMI